MSVFRVGQKVVCVKGSSCERLFRGEVYEISAVGFGLTGEAMVDVAGVINPCPEQSPAWFATRFRPVVERKTDIEIFRRMLNTTPETVGAA